MLFFLDFDRKPNFSRKHQGGKTLKALQKQHNKARKQKLLEE